MEAASEWTCPICGHHQDEAAYVTPCLHKLCYGCAIWWAKKQHSCALCGHKIKTIRYSVRADDDYIECPVPSPAVHLGYNLQGEKGSPEPKVVAPEHSFPPEVWAAFFQRHPRNLRPLLQWLQREIRRSSGDEWWDVHAKQSIILSFLCVHGLDEAILLQKLQPSLRGNTVRFVRRIISISAALYGPELRQQQNHQDTHAAEGQDSPATSSRPVAFHEGPPASGISQSTRSARPSTEELPSILHGDPRNPTNTTVPSEEPQEEADQAAVAGPSTQGRDHLPGGHHRPSKRKASSSTQDLPPPSKRWSQRQH
ncbi:E3 ubiquitin-protein ligase Topors-like [Numida meleagris]|uniref:E3 ubiquitin-protein ligase Topors-like n=1 Tax=Numida meleagris TaxID=8996 RepID=UPI000B3DADA9|nr:E3 ubiquitin-protein ligase Topors-like [Numida meleagris]